MARGDGGRALLGAKGISGAEARDCTNQKGAVHATEPSLESRGGKLADIRRREGRIMAADEHSWRREKNEGWEQMH